MTNEVEFSVLQGQIITKFDVADDELTIVTSEHTYKMEHYQDCCEHVYIDDICGDLELLLNTPVLLAEVVTNNDYDTHNYESATWTFYKINTIKDSITIRWCGESNGYYSEEVSFVQLKV